MDVLGSVMRIFGPAVAGAAMQLIAVGLMTALFYLLARARYFSPGWPFALCDANTVCQAPAPLLRLSYLMTAVGVALTNNRLIARTTSWARDTSRAMLPKSFRFSAKAVAVQLSIVTIACIVEELEDPSHFVVISGRWIGGVWLGAILGPALWSLVVAASGSLVHALFDAARQT